MKKLKSKIIFLLLCLVIMFVSLGTASAQRHQLIGKVFQSQYYNGVRFSILIYFKSPTEIVIEKLDLVTNQLFHIEGTCEHIGNSIHFTVKGNNNKEIIYREWKTEYSIIIGDGNGNVWKYAISESPEDTFMKDYLTAKNANIYIPSYSNQSYSPPTQTYTPTKKTCPACGGSGWYSRYGQSGRCSGCGGTGWIIN